MIFYSNQSDLDVGDEVSEAPVAYFTDWQYATGPWSPDEGTGNEITNEIRNGTDYLVDEVS